MLCMSQLIVSGGGRTSLLCTHLMIIRFGWLFFMMYYRFSVVALYLQKSAWFEHMAV